MVKNRLENEINLYLLNFLNFNLIRLASLTQNFTTKLKKFISNFPRTLQVSIASITLAWSCNKVDATLHKLHGVNAKQLKSPHEEIMISLSEIGMTQEAEKLSKHRSSEKSPSVWLCVLNLFNGKVNEK
jgi:hypothetical protein